MANNGGRSVDLKALLSRVQGIPIHSTKFEYHVQDLPNCSAPVKINQEPGLTDIVRNLEQQIERIMTTQLDKFEERVQKMPINSTPVKIHQEPGLDNFVRILDQQMARIRTAQLDKFEERAQGMPFYSTPVKIDQEPGLIDIVRNLEQQMERIMTAQLDKFEEIVGVMNSLKTDYKQMGTKFEKLQADVTVLQARLGDANSVDNQVGVPHQGEEKASHDGMHDTKGGVMRISDNNCNETNTDMGAGRCRVTKALNSNSISHVPKIYPLYKERNDEAEVPSTHGEFNNTFGGKAFDSSMKGRYRPVFAFEEGS